MMTNHLFSPTRLGSIDLPNRVVMAPMTRRRADDDGTPNALMAEYYAQRASAGLIVSEMTIVSDDSIAYLNAPGLYTPSHLGGWTAVTNAVHRAGGRIVAQIAHAGRVSHPSLQPNGQLPVAPSAIKPEGRIYTQTGPTPFVTPRALETADIPHIVDQFRQAALVARKAGFDGIELHAANGYLLDEFLRDGTNHRTDEYGGSALNRARLLIEVVNAVAEVWPADRVGVRLSPFNAYNDMSDSDPVATFSTAASGLAPLGLAFLHVVEPVSSGTTPLTATMRKLFAGPVIANGGYTAETAHRAIEDGVGDAVSFGAPFIANPDLTERFQRGLPLAVGDQSTFYMGGAHGYVDYPRYAAAAA
jgi:N-ethylmaleimide reductase